MHYNLLFFISLIFTNCSEDRPPVQKQVPHFLVKKTEDFSLSKDLNVVAGPSPNLFPLFCNTYPF